eukprot:763544-Hanusia_phi.AAC.4
MKDPFNDFFGLLVVGLRRQEAMLKVSPPSCKKENKFMYLGLHEPKVRRYLLDDRLIRVHIRTLIEHEANIEHELRPGVTRTRASIGSPGSQEGGREREGRGRRRDGEAKSKRVRWRGGGGSGRKREKEGWEGAGRTPVTLPHLVPLVVLISDVLRVSDESQPEGSDADQMPAELARGDEVVGEVLAGVRTHKVLWRLEDWARALVGIKLAVQDAAQPCWVWR